MRLRFYYDVVCPYAWIAASRIDALASDAGVEVDWRPILLGGVLRAVGSPDRPMDVMSPARARTNLMDVQRQTERSGMPATFPMGHPRRTVDAMRLIHAVPEEHRRALSLALYRAYWVEGADVADPVVLDRVGSPFGVGAADAERGRQALYDTTAEAVEAGVFGVPAFVWGERLWWGSDRLRLLLAELWKGRSRLTFFHDFSSPYSYLASTQIEALAARHHTSVDWTPILVGGLFKAIGTPGVPFNTFAPRRQEYQRTDMADWASWWGVPFRFTSHFPLRTVTALRVSIVEPRAIPTLYRAAWVDDVELGDDAVLSDYLTANGFPGAELVDATRDPAVKARLHANTERAVAAGCCGVPSFQVDGGLVVWGQDRLDLVEAALDGWRPLPA